MDFEFTDLEEKAVFEDPRVFQLVIDYHENRIAMGDSMDFNGTYHYQRLEELKEAQSHRL